MQRLCHSIILLAVCGSSVSAEDESGVLFEQMKQLSRRTVVQIGTPGSQQLKQPRWTYCFASFFSAPLEVRWPNRDLFETTDREVKFQDLPSPPTPSEKPFVRLQQMKQMARRFTATIENRPDGSNSETMRMLPKPVFLYPQQPEFPSLAVFGFASSGTNPDAYLVLQTQADEDNLKWTYGLRRMTTGAIRVKLDTGTVWETDWVKPIGGPVGQEGWIFFYEERGQDR